MMYIAAAASALPVPAIPAARAAARALPDLQPVGVRHAISAVLLGRTEPQATCGADITRWSLFPAVTFDPGHPAACQRCAQLVSAATRASHPPRLTVARPDLPRAPG